MSVGEPPETAPRVIVYDLETTGAANAIKLLQAAIPDAQFAVGNDPGKLIAWARPEDHELISAAVEQFEAESWLQGNRIMAVYPIKSGDAESLLEVLDPMLKEHAQFVVDPERNSLIVWAESKYHDAINKAVEQYIEGVSGVQELTPEVYRFQRADPSAAFAVLRSLVPSAQIAMDTVNRSLVVSALPEDHEKIKATIEEMEREDAGGQAPLLQVHRVTSADPANLLTVLQSLFRRNPLVQLSLDQNNDSIIAYASPLEHEKIEELIREVEKGKLLDSTATLELYSLKDVDADAAMEILTTMLQKRGAKVDLSFEPRSNQLVALGQPDQQALIGQVIEELRGEETKLQIYQLEYLDPYTAEIAIGRLYDYDDPERPEIDTDPMTQQLFVRATQKQHDEVRRLLIEMGEVRLAMPSGDGPKTRVIRFEGDVEEVLKEIRRVWPKLRKNDLQVMTPSEFEAAHPSPGQAKESPTQAPQSDTQKKPEPSQPAPAKPSPEPAKGSEKPSAKKPATDKPATDKPATDKPATDKPAGSTRWRVDAEVHVGEWVTAAPADEEPPQAGSGQGAESQTPPAASEESTQAAGSGAEPPPAESPVIVVPGEGSITVYSDDPEALEQFESLLRTLAQPGSYVDRNLSVFQLQHTSATLVAEKIENILRTSPFGWRGGYGSVTIVPDERLNQIIVEGSRLDRERIEGLVKVLDSNQVPETLAANKPRIVPIRNTDATQIEQVIRDVFRTQLTPYTRTSRTSSRGSSGMPLNLTPELTVDEVTNSLIVKASSPLVDEIVELAQTLDEAAGEERARGLKIISLKKANASRVEEALNAIIRGSSPSRRR